MINLFDNFENALKNTDNEDLIKYYFEFNIENEYKLKCNHNINHIENLYKLELEIENNINDSINGLLKYKDMNIK